MAGITSHQKNLGENSLAVRNKLIERTANSEKIATKGQAVLAQEIVQTVDLPHQIYIDSAEGPYLTDLDGNQYIDLTGGFGPNVLGNKPEAVETALSAQIKKGWHYGIPSDGQAHLAQLIKDSSPSVDEVMFCNSGSEATMFAFRGCEGSYWKKSYCSFRWFVSWYS